MKQLLGILTLFSFALLMSCGDDDPTGPTPVVSFSQDRMIIETGESVTFTNSTTEAVSYLWDFGDGSTSTDESPVHTYSALGTFEVTIAATGSGGITVRETTSVVVGQRYANSIIISSINFEDANMNPWDDDQTGPDVLFGFAKSSETTIDLFNLGEDLESSDLPLGGTIDMEGGMAFTDEAWVFLFIDNDEPLDELDLQNQDATMYATEVNPTTLGSKDFETGEGSFTISEFGFEYTIGFVVR